MGKARTLLCAGAVVLSVMWVRPASACLNGTVMEADEVARNVKLAEQALSSGRYREVFTLLDADHYFAHDRLIRRIYVLKAVAHLRLGHARTAERRLRRLLRGRRKDPYLETRLAESLATRKGDDAIEAWQILDRLERKDLIPDARGYATLAELRRRAGDIGGRLRALNRCRQMAGPRWWRICPSA